MPPTSATARRIRSVCESAVATPPPAGRPRRGRGGPAGLVVLVEEGQGWKFVSSGCGAITPRLVDPMRGPVIPTRAAAPPGRVPARAVEGGSDGRHRGVEPHRRAWCWAATGSGARLGSGGFGTVYAAHDERLDRCVAVKVIPAHGPAPERAQREALAAARLDHPGIVAVYDAGEEDDARYLVSELVRGRTLDVLERDGALSDRDVLRVGLALADALGHAHERGVIHRDVKPQNVIVPGRAAACGGQADRLRRRAPGRRRAADPHRRRGRHARLHGARAGGGRAGRRARRPLRARARALRGAGGRQPGPRRRPRPPRPAASATVLPRAALAPARPAAGAVRRARPRAGARSRRARHARRAGRRRSRTRCPRSPTTAARSPRTRWSGPRVCRRSAARPPGRPPRADRARAGGGRRPPRSAAAWLPATVRASASRRAARGAAAAFAARRAAPARRLAARRGRLRGRARRAVAGGRRAGAAARRRAAAAAARAAGSWSLPAAAPCSAWPGWPAPTPPSRAACAACWARAALGAAGAVVAAARRAAARSRDRRRHGARRAPATCSRRSPTSGALLLAPLWAAAAVVLPWLVRGRSRRRSTSSGPPTWAAALAAATAAVAGSAGLAEPRGLAAGAVVAGVLAVVGARRGILLNPAHDRPRTGIHRFQPP